MSKKEFWDRVRREIFNGRTLTMQPKRSRVLIVGTGLIGYELIRRVILASSQWPWQEIIFHKRSALAKNLDKIGKLFELAKAAGVSLKLCVDAEKMEEFRKIGYHPAYTFEQALDRADIVFDATPEGLVHKHRFYEKSVAANPRQIFVAQGSEFRKDKKFGRIYIGGVNEESVLRDVKNGEQFFVVGSCNGHAIARNVVVWEKTLRSPFVWSKVRFKVSMLRRSDDRNKEKVAASFSFSAPDARYREEGTYHAYSVKEAFRSVGQEVQLRTRVGKLTDPYQHCLFWEVTVPAVDWLLRSPDWPEWLREAFIQELRNDPWCAVTSELQSNIVEEESTQTQHFYVEPWLRADRPYYHTIVCLPTIDIYLEEDRITIEYGTFTPQRSNVIWTNLALSAMVKEPEKFKADEFLRLTKPLLEPKEI